MKITFNIEKKHLLILIFILISAGIGIVIASTYDSVVPSHEVLWTKEIKGKNVDTITVPDNLLIASGKGIYLGGVKKTSWPWSSSDKDCFVTLYGNAPYGYSALEYRIKTQRLDTAGKCVAKCNTNYLCGSYPIGSWTPSQSALCETNCRAPTAEDLPCADINHKYLIDLYNVETDYAMYCK